MPEEKEQKRQGKQRTERITGPQKAAILVLTKLFWFHTGKGRLFLSFFFT